MSSLFSKPKAPTPTPVPTIDEARQTVEGKKRSSKLRGRAASILASTGTAATAARQVTGT